MTRPAKISLAVGLAVIAWAAVLTPFSLRIGGRDVDLVLAGVGLALLGLAAPLWVCDRVRSDITIPAGLAVALWVLAACVLHASALSEALS